MALTFARTGRQAWTGGGGKRWTVTDVTLVDNYVTGGWPITARNLGFDTNSTVDYAYGTVNGYTFQYDYSAKKLKAFSAPGTELANASAALSGVVARVIALGN